MNISITKIGLRSRGKLPAPDFSLAIINVIFLLLFFFILTGAMVQRSEMEIAPPLTTDLPLERLPRPLVVISDQESLFLDGEPIGLQALIANITVRRKNPDAGLTHLNILADEKLPARTFLSVIDTLREADLPLRIVTVRSSRKLP